MRAYASYYNGVRTHRSLNKDAPVHPPTQRIGILRSAALLRALLQWRTNTPVAGQGLALPRVIQAVGSILPRPILGGLHHHYVRI